MRKKSFSPIVFWIVFLLLAVIFLWQAVSPFIFGIMLCFLLNPLVKRFEKLGLKRTPSILIVTLFFMLTIFLFFAFIAPIVLQESYNIWKNLEGYLKEGKSLFHTFTQTLIKMGLPINEKQIINSLVSQLNGMLAPFFTSLFNYLFKSINVLLTLILIPLTIFYVLKDKDKLIQVFRQYLSNKTSEKIKQIAADIALKLKGYVRSVLLLGLIAAVFMIVLLSIWGVRYPLALGIFSGIISIIPYLGPTIQIIFIAIIQVSSGAVLPSVIWLGLVQVGFYGLIGFYLQPKLTSISVKIHPLMVIVSIMIGNYIYGILGMILSIPVYIIIQTVTESWMEKYHHHL